MAKFDLKTLIGKLNTPCRKALEDAAAFCVSQTNYNVEVEHFLTKLLESPNTDLQVIFSHYEINLENLNRDLTSSIDRLKRGNSRTPSLSPHISYLLEEAWLINSLYFEGSKIRSGTLLLAMLENEVLRGVILDSIPTLLRIPKESLRQEIKNLVTHSLEEKSVDKKQSNEIKATNQQTTESSKNPALAQYTIDLTDRARQGLIDPVEGRDFEIRQVIDILTRRRQNNPILTGEAGVGKTAIVEGFALKVAKADAPPSLKDISVRLLDLGLLQAGAGIKGEFENRLKSVIREVTSSPQPVILFIDEAHTMIGAGGTAGQGDAANLLKPALARGELRTIAATTWSEYKKYFEKDAALARRFQVIKVDEPNETQAIDMLRAIVDNLEKHHNVYILNEAVRDAVKFSNRYITGRQLPDKAISVLDTACARVSIGQNAMPAALEDIIHQLENLAREINILQREALTGYDHTEKIAEIKLEIEQLSKTQKTLTEKWQEELALVKQIRDQQLQASNEHSLKSEISYLQDKLKSIQKENPLVPLYVDSHLVASVVSGWTGIPIGKMLADEIDNILKLEEKLAERVVGQSQALDAISRRIRTSRANLDDPNKPVGVFLLIGPSGVGKTETAITLSDLIYGGERNLITINMSEYQESYSISNLKGAPPGYVGYGKGGVLTEAVRRNPYSVILLDEIEKAHADVVELFYQVFDKGQMEDSEGVTINFRNTIIILTSNVGSEFIIKLSEKEASKLDLATLTEAFRPELLKHFKAAFLGRLVVIPYYSLGDEQISKIVDQKMAKIQKRFQENYHVNLTYDQQLVESIVARCTEVESGARNIDNILTHSLLPEISKQILSQIASSESFSAIHIGFNGQDFTYSFGK